MVSGLTRSFRWTLEPGGFGAEAGKAGLRLEDQGCLLVGSGFARFGLWLGTLGGASVVVFYGFTARVCGSQLLSIRPTQVMKSSGIMSRMLN